MTIVITDPFKQKLYQVLLENELGGNEAAAYQSKGSASHLISQAHHATSPTH